MPVDLPKATFSIIPAQQVAGVSEQRALIVGQLLAAGLATGGTLIRDFPNDGSEDSLFDKTSHIAGLVRDFKTINKVTDLDVLPLSDGAGTEGAAVITLSAGPATADASIFVTIGSKKKLRFQVDIVSGDAITAIGDAIVAAFAVVTNKPFTIANAIGVVTATATNKGTLSNNWGLSIEGTIPGVTIALTGWTGGATDPTLTGILDAIGDTRYQTILWPSAYALDEVQDLLDARFNASNAVLDGVAMQVKVDTLSNLKSYISALNSQSVVIPVQKLISDDFNKGPATLEFPDVASAQICAIRALRLTQDANLTQYLTTVAPNDQFGGIAIASLPYFNTSLPQLPVASPGDDFSGLDLDELTDNGAAAFGPNRVYNGTIFGEFVTSYLTDGAGNPDDSFKFLNTVDTSSAIREFYFANTKSRYAQTRLTDGDLVSGRDMANEASIRAFCNELYDNLADDVLTQKGAAAKKDYNDNLVISLNVRSGTATINQAPLLVSQMRATIGTIQINFGG